MSKVTLRAAFVALLLATLAGISGCKRSQEAFDDRTLEKRPHVETVKPQDRGDAFRP